MLNVHEVKADGTGQTWGTTLVFVWKPQKTSSPEMKPGVLLFQPAQSVTCEIKSQSAQNVPKKQLFNYIWLCTYKGAISSYVRTNIFTSIHLVKPLLLVGVKGLHTAFNLSRSQVIAKAMNWHIFQNTLLAKALYVVIVVRLTTV